ncbi:hypothetical protein [Nonomuraea angiospora]
MSTEDFAPLIDAAAESGSDVLFLRSCLADSIGLVRALRSHEFRPKMVGGAMATGGFDDASLSPTRKLSPPSDEGQQKFCERSSQVGALKLRQVHVDTLAIYKSMHQFNLVSMEQDPRGRRMEDTCQWK